MQTYFRTVNSFDSENLISIDLDFNWNSDYIESLARVWQLKKIRGMDFFRDDDR